MVSVSRIILLHSSRPRRAAKMPRIPPSGGTVVLGNWSWLELNLERDGIPG